MARALATLSPSVAPLSAVLARVAEQRLDDFTVNSIANTACAFAEIGELNAPLFVASAKMFERRVNLLNAQGLSDAA